MYLNHYLAFRVLNSLGASPFYLCAPFTESTCNQLLFVILSFTTSNDEIEALLCACFFGCNGFRSYKKPNLWLLKHWTSGEISTSKIGNYYFLILLVLRRILLWADKSSNPALIDECSPGQSDELTINGFDIKLLCSLAYGRYNLPVEVKVSFNWPLLIVCP